MGSFDTIVLGAGVAGSASALALARRGQRVLLLEQHALLHARGSSHGGSRIFRHAYEDARYVRLALAADAAWQALERETGERLLYRSGGLDIGRAGSAALQRIASALDTAERSYEHLGAAEVARRFPAFRLAAGQEALYQRDAGILPATRALAVMQREARRRGAEVRAHERVVALTLAPELCVSTARGRYQAERLVVTAGPWLGELGLGLELPLSVERQQVLYLRVDDEAPHRLGRCPVFINRDSEVYGFPIFERAGTVKVSNHAGAPTITLSERSFELHEQAAQETVAQAREFMPYLSGDIEHFETCLYTKTPDEHFLLDLHPAHPNVAIGGGFSGHGFKFGPLLGELLADVLEGRRAHDLSLFGLARFGSAARAMGAPGWVS